MSFSIGVDPYWFMVAGKTAVGRALAARPGWGLIGSGEICGRARS